MDKKTFWTVILYIATFEIVSFALYYSPNYLNIAGFIALAVLFSCVGVVNPRTAAVISAIELFIGGMGYLFHMDINGYMISGRMVIFGIMAALWLTGVIMTRRIKFLHSKFLVPYLIFFAFLIVGLINALLRKNGLSNIFFDFNAYIFFLYLPIWYEFLSGDYTWNRLWTAAAASYIWLSAKTMLVLYFFSHNIEWAVWPLYHWIRNTGVGEITLMMSNIFRVFFQSQIYPLIGLSILVAILILHRDKLNPLEKKLLIIFMSVGAAVVLISLSRSFWLGAAVSLPIIFIFALIRKISFLRIIGRATLGLLALCIGFMLIAAVVKFPIPTPGAGSLGTMLLERADIGAEAAASSRWNLLPVLWQGIINEPFLGQGFGAQVTYISNDPRVRAEYPTGEYTTSAMEWGLLDIWYKIGILGIAAYLWLMVRLGKTGIVAYLKNSDNVMPLALTIGLVVLFITNFFTPYLNHPLGIGYLLLMSCYLERDRTSG
ncbi:MAG: O-antigen ligase family protein [Patescibacteria group bacterium]|nr:O-antigen ligase family protein [Patescibacteria group bacterium]